MIYLASLAVLLCILATISRNDVWAGGVRTIWQDAARKSPNAPEVHLSLGKEYHSTGNAQAAFREYQKSADLASKRLNRNHRDFRSRDTLASAQSNLGALLIQYGDYRNAEIALQNTRHIIPGFGPAMILLSQLYNDTHDYSESISIVDSALQSHAFGPAFQGYGQLYFNKAIALCAEGFPSPANDNFKKAASLDPDIRIAQCGKENPHG